MKKLLYLLLLASSFIFAESGDLVRLKDFGSTPMVIGLIPGDETKSYLIPNNTKAIILEWYRNYKIKDIPSRHKEMLPLFYSKVKILNGPLKDTILLVNHIYIFLE